MSRITGRRQVGNAMLEVLEDRLMLTAGYEVTGEVLATWSDPDLVKPDWFATPELQPDPSTPLTEDHLASGEMAQQAEPRIGTIVWNGEQVEAAEGRWIVQLTSEYVGTVGSLDQVAETFSGNASGVEVVRGLGREGLIQIEAQAWDVAETRAWLDQHDGVAYYEPELVIHRMSAIPNDPGYGSQWALENNGANNGIVDADIDAERAWSLTTGRSDVVVAVIDQAVDSTHEDLIDNMWTNPGETPGNGIDDDGNGLIDDYYGYDFIHYDGDPNVANTGDDHGTHVAGIIAAQGNNAKGISGVAWDVQIMSLKVFENSRAAFLSGFVTAINYTTVMANRGINVKVSNNSWGGYGFSSSMQTAIASSGEAGILFVAAAGNGGSDRVGDNNDSRPFYPASYPVENVVSVANSTRRDERSSSSNFGAISVDLAAPGSSIYSTEPGHDYGTKSGTSMASPQVAGAAALLWSLDPEATVDEVKQVLLDSVDPVSAFATNTVSGGRLNVGNAAEAILQGVAPTSLIVEGTDGDDEIQLIDTADASRIQIWLNDALTRTVPTVSLESISVSSGSGQDRIRIATGHIGTIAIDPGTDADILIIDDSYKIDSLSYEITPTELRRGPISEPSPKLTLSWTEDLETLEVDAGEGHDRFTVVGDGPTTQILAGSGDDHFVIASSGSMPTHLALLNGQGGRDVIDYATWTDGVSVDLVRGVASGVDQLINVEDGIGGEGADTLVGGQGANILIGNGGHDLLVGGNGNDLLEGGNDDDTLSGGGDQDTLSGGSGHDSLNGDQMADSLDGGPGQDTLIGRGGNDTLSGEEGNDLIRGGKDDDLIFGGVGNDTLEGNNGPDTLEGGDHDDRLDGGQGEDSLMGQLGEDTLEGGRGRNELDGGAGADLYHLVGGVVGQQHRLDLAPSGATRHRRLHSDTHAVATDLMTVDAFDLILLEALGGHDWVSIDAAVSVAGSLDGGTGTDTLSLPESLEANWSTRGF